jgi:adenine-specific DNA glycosylase
LKKKKKKKKKPKKQEPGFAKMLLLVKDESATVSKNENKKLLAKIYYTSRLNWLGATRRGSEDGLQRNVVGKRKKIKCTKMKFKKIKWRRDKRRVTAASHKGC